MIEMKDRKDADEYKRMGAIKREQSIDKQT